MRFILSFLMVFGTYAVVVCMILTDDKTRVAVLFSRLARAQTITTAIYEELHPIFERSSGFDEAAGALANLLGSRVDPEALFERPIISVSARTVTWRGRSCKLGNTTLFRLMERLSRRPNWHVTYEQLLGDVWERNKRSDETIRSTVSQLKRKLKAEEMDGLAGAIRTDNRSCYLDLDGIERPDCL